MNISELFTLDLHEKPKKLKLKDREGKEIGQHLMIVGLDSATFAKNAGAVNSDLLGIKAGDNIEIIKHAYFLAASISDWSFDDEFTQENARELIFKNKTIRSELNKFVEDYSNWGEARKK